MATCQKVGARCWLTHHPGGTRKLKYSWQAIEMGDGWVGIHTGSANTLVAEAIQSGLVPQLPKPDTLAREVKLNDKTRLDLRLDYGAQKVFVEVKNVTLDLGQGLAAFPDTVTRRGLKHLQELAELVQSGHRAVLFFCVQRCGATKVSPAWQHDPDYAETLVRVAEAGVEILAWRAEIDRQGVRLKQPLPVVLDPPFGSC